MKLSRWFVVAPMLLLTGCNTVVMGRLGVSPDSERGFNVNLVAKPDRERVRVWIINNGIVIDQEPVRIPAGITRVAVRWILPDTIENYTFPAGGIGGFTPVTGSLPSDLECGIVDGSDNRIYRCTYTGTPQTQFKYTVKVLANGAMLQRLDPTVMMD